MSIPFPVSSKQTSTLAEPNLRRSQRARQPPPQAVNGSKSQPRKRRHSAVTARNGQKSAAKKLKLEGQKTQTAIVNDKREARDNARKRWLHWHREIIEPLLPPSSAVFKQLEDSSQLGVHKTTLHEQPALIKGGIMKDYQLDGLSFLVTMYKNGMNCILGDEMGLGKTLQTLALFAYIKENIPGSHDPHLIICPLSVLQSWEAETARWVPSMRAVRFHGPLNERNRIKASLLDHGFDILITTYESYSAEDQWFKTRRWTYCVLDEGHTIKNFETNISHRVQGLGSLYRLILTGTPVQNNLTELWGLLHWLLPIVFTPASYALFKNSFDLTRGSYELSFLNAAKKLVSIIMLRRTKAVVAGGDVPPREELTVFIPLTEAQRFWTYRLLTRLDTPDLEKIFESTSVKTNDGTYDILMKEEESISIKTECSTLIKTEEQGVSLEEREVFAQIENNISVPKGTRWKNLMNLLMQLRKVCDHPYLLPNAEPEPYFIGEHVVASSSKLTVIDKLLADILPKGERVLIFSQWTGMLDALEDFMALRSIPYARLDGSTPRPRRSLDIRLFQQEKSPYQVYLVSTKAGGLGINLTKASTVIMCDSDWNPQNDLQAIARAHRIGQTKVVKVYRLICQGSVEDQMLDRIRRKLFLSVKIMGSGNSNSADNTSLGSNELLSILRKGSSALAHSENGMNMARFSSSSIAEILEHSRALENMRNTKVKREFNECGDDGAAALDVEEEERRLLSGVAQVHSRLFEGKIVRRATNVEIAQEWHELEKRPQVDRLVQVNGPTCAVSSIHERIVHPAEVTAKKTRRRFESEDWCNVCRDGGELLLCAFCPRVFHQDCRGLTDIEARKATVSCSQHSCTDCQRSTSDAGGMLFRCRTCPRTFCEDCLPEGEINAVGETLPEFLVLGFAQTSSAYFIQCSLCVADYQEDPKSEFWQCWAEEISQAEQKLREAAGAGDVKP